MTIEQYIIKIDKAIQAIQKKDFLKIAVLDTVAKQSKRIFQDGLKSDNSKIGNYNNTKEVWISENQAPKKLNHKGKTGKRIKGGYYSSYKAFRQAMGRESQFVNIRLTNDLQSDFNNSALSKRSNSLAKSKPIKIKTNSYKTTLKREVNQNKKDGLEKKYGTIFNLTTEEKNNFFKIASKEFALAREL